MSSEREIRVVVQHSRLDPYEQSELDLLKREDWEKCFSPDSIQTIVAEHVWEHLGFDKGVEAAKNSYRFLNWADGSGARFLMDTFQIRPTNIESK